MESKQQTSKTYFRELSIISNAFFIGILFIGAASFSCSIDEAVVYKKTTSNFIILLVVILSNILIVFGSGNVVYKRLVLLREMTNLREKMAGYKKMIISRMTFIGLGCVIPLLVFAETGGIGYLILTGFMFFLLGCERPDLESAIINLKLNKQEIEILGNPESII